MAKKRRDGESGRGPVAMADVLSELLTRRGYARSESSRLMAEAWAAVVGEPMARVSRASRLRGRTLEVLVADSTLVQEFTLQKAALIEALNRILADHSVKDLRFRVGLIEPEAG